MTFFFLRFLFSIFFYFIFNFCCQICCSIFFFFGFFYVSCPITWTNNVGKWCQLWYSHRIYYIKHNIIYNIIRVNLLHAYPIDAWNSKKIYLFLACFFHELCAVFSMFYSSFLHFIRIKQQSATRKSQPLESNWTKPKTKECVNLFMWLVYKCKYV